MSQVLRVIQLVVIFICLAACSDIGKTSSGRFGLDKPVFASPVQSGAPTVDPQQSGQSGALQPGTDKFVGTNRASREGAPERVAIRSIGADEVEISLRAASIPAAAKAILGDALEIDYTVSDKVEGTITIQTTGPVPVMTLLNLFEVALEANGARLEKIDGGARIVAAKASTSTYRLASQGVRPGSQIIVAPLKYVSAEEMVGLLRPLVDEGLVALPFRDRNLLLLIGSEPILDASLDALNLFDVDVLRGKSVALVRLKSADPDAIVGELRTIFETEEGGVLDGVMEFVPNQRLGSVLIISRKSEYLGRARDWIRELDTTAVGSTLYLKTYHLQNRTATEVAPILNGLIGEQESVTVSDVSAEGRQESETATITSSDPTNGSRVVADDGRNAVIVRARRTEHTEIESLLRTLDNPARQVLLEATIAEVTLNDEVNVGVRWFFEKGDFAVGFSDLFSGAARSSFPGFSAIIASGGAGVALNALSSVTDVNVISSPTLMVVDNKEGILQIGDEVPVATQTGTPLNQESIVLTQVEYRETGIILKVQPRIGQSGRVTLDISQEVSDVSSTRTSGIDSPTISQRLVQTSVVLYDGQTLVLGGLVQENDNVASTQTPVLGEVPVLGALFRNKESEKRRTELLIMIRPRVIYDHSAAGAITAEWRRKLQDTDSILQTGLGEARHTLRELVE